jgi:hypothetical protein
MVSNIHNVYWQQFIVRNVRSSLSSLLERTIRLLTPSFPALENHKKNFQMINTQKRISSKQSKLKLLVPNLRADRAEFRVDKSSAKLVINRAPLRVSVEFGCCKRLKLFVIIKSSIQFFLEVLFLIIFGFLVE